MERRVLRPADVGLLVLINLLWGSTYVVARGTLDTVPPLVLAFVRFAVASACMVSIGAHRPSPGERAEEDPRARQAAWLSLAALGIVGFGAAKVLNYEGLRRSTATDAALIINLEAVFTALFGAWFLRERLRPVQWAGILLAFAGGVALVWPEDPSETASGRVLGNALMIASVAAEALASVLGAAATARYSGLRVTALATYWGTAVLVPAAALQARGADAAAWLTWGNAAAVLYLALGATVAAYVLWFRAVARVGAGRAAVFLYAQPLVGVALGILLRHEWPGRWGLLGTAAVLLGIALTLAPAPPPQ